MDIADRHPILSRASPVHGAINNSLERFVSTLDDEKHQNLPAEASVTVKQDTRSRHEIPHVFQAGHNLIETPFQRNHGVRPTHGSGGDVAWRRHVSLPQLLLLVGSSSKLTYRRFLHFFRESCLLGGGVSMLRVYEL